MPRRGQVLFLLCFLVAFAAAAGANESREILWEDLVPEVEPYDDPFPDLTYEQIDDLRTVLALEEATPEFRELPENVVLLEEARARLEEAGLDIAYLFRQREVVMEKRLEQATTVNMSVVDQTVRLPGYLLPLEMKGRKVVEFLLVPYVGACIHTPPPDPNQIVHVVYPRGFEAEGLFTPVRITGRMIAQSSRQTVAYADGRSDVIVSYTMKALSVEGY